MSEWSAECALQWCPVCVCVYPHAVPRTRRTLRVRTGEPEDRGGEREKEGKIVKKRSEKKVCMNSYKRKSV